MRKSLHLGSDTVVNFELKEKLLKNEVHFPLSVMQNDLSFNSVYLSIEQARKLRDFLVKNIK
jgi:hypothetical protein